MAIYSPAFLLLTLSGLALWGCSSADKKDPLLVEAATYHTQATEIQAVLEPQIDRIDSLKTVLATQKTPDATARLATLDSLKTAFELWEANLVEVPGMPHTHNHSGKHEHYNHADATLKDLPTAQMRDLQREILTTVKQIQARFETVKP